MLGHDVRAVGRIKQTVQCVKNGRVKGNIHLEGKVVRDLFSLLDVDCLASSKTYERLMGKKPPDPVDEGYDSQGEIPNLGGDDEEDKSEEEIDHKEEEKEKNSIVKNQEQVPPDPPDDRDPRPSLSIIKSENYTKQLTSQLKTLWCTKRPDRNIQYSIPTTSNDIETST